MTIVLYLMEYLKPYTQQQIVVTTLTLFLGGIFTRKIYKNKNFKEMERKKTWKRCAKLIFKNKFFKNTN